MTSFGFDPKHAAFARQPLRGGLSLAKLPALRDPAEAERRLRHGAELAVANLEQVKPRSRMPLE